MGANDAKEMLEVAKAEVVRLEAERDEWKRLFTECHPAHLDAVTKLEQVRRLHEIATERTVQLAAVIERAHAALSDSANYGDGGFYRAAALLDDLEEVETGAALRERDAEKFDEGWMARSRRDVIHPKSDPLPPHASLNPYRGEADRG